MAYGLGMKLFLDILMLRTLKIYLTVCLIAAMAGGVWGCASAAKTAYQGETIAYVSLKAAADGYRAFKATHAVSAADDAKAHQLFDAAKNDEILAVQLTESATNGVVGVATSTNLTAFVTFLKQLGVTL